MLDAINDRRICNTTYINNRINNKALRKVANINISLKRVYDFLTESNLIVILADKNLGLTIVNKDWYHTNMRKHFENTEAFSAVDVTNPAANVARIEDGKIVWKPLFTRWEYSLRTLVQTHYGRGEISRAYLDKHWSWEFGSFPRPYGLIKLHKTPPKLRYITPVVDWLNRKVADDIVSFLNTYVGKVDWILSSSMELIKLIDESVNNVRHQPQNKSLWIGSWDVQDMYNQIDQRESIVFIEYLAQKQGWITSTNRKRWSFYFSLITWVYATSYVAYNDEVWLQKRGLPMGSPLSPVIANLYMAALEVKATAEFESFRAYSSSIIYRRYLDDILIICRSSTIRIDDSEGCNPLEEDAAALNSFMMRAAVRSNIALDYTGNAWRDGESIEYLDLRLKVYNRNGKKWIGTSVFDKPTNLHIYTDPSTWYPFHYVYNWIQGENIRLIRNSSDIKSYQDTLVLFRDFLFRRKYCERQIQNFLQKNTWDDRAALLRGEKPHLERQGKGKGKKSKQDAFILIDNSGCRDIITQQVKLIDNIASVSVPDLGLHFLPVVKKGKTILSVMTNMRTPKTG